MKDIFIPATIETGICTYLSVTNYVVYKLKKLGLGQIRVVLMGKLMMTTMWN
jgi:hypothetical protein